MYLQNHDLKYQRAERYENVRQKAVWNSVIMGDISGAGSGCYSERSQQLTSGRRRVDGAIHRAAGLQLLEECRALGGCPTGEARIIQGYRLPAKWVIHTVGPVWDGGNSGEEVMLESAYRNSLELAVEYGLQSIAFPRVSIGAYGFPVGRASIIAVRTISEFIASHGTITNIRLICFNETALLSYSKALDELFQR